MRERLPNPLDFEAVSARAPIHPKRHAAGPSGCPPGRAFHLGLPIVPVSFAPTERRDTTRAMKQLLIFDFDGVIADSEVLSNTVLAECVSAIGLPTTREDSYSRYMGKR